MTNGTREPDPDMREGVFGGSGLLLMPTTVACLLHSPTLLQAWQCSPAIAR